MMNFSKFMSKVNDLNVRIYNYFNAKLIGTQFSCSEYSIPVIRIDIENVTFGFSSDCPMHCYNCAKNDEIKDNKTGSVYRIKVACNDYNNSNCSFHYEIIVDTADKETTHNKMKSLYKLTESSAVALFLN